MGKRKIERKISLPSNKPVMNETILMGLLRTACCSKVNAANKKEKIIIRARGNIRINTGLGPYCEIFQVFFGSYYLMPMKAFYTSRCIDF